MVFFQLPDTLEILTLNENKGQDEFSLISFDAKEKLSFSGTLQSISEEELRSYPLSIKDLSPSPPLREETKEDYLLKTQKAIEWTKKNQLEKLVLSRRKIVSIDSLSLAESFLSLKAAYPSALTYLIIKDKECWMGAFSELLGSYDQKSKEFKTMALAGTLPLEHEWSEKEIKEQAAVTSYVRDVVSKENSEFKESQPYSHPSGRIKHLRVDFSTTLEKEQVEPLIKELHPTPAVLGRPKELCLEAIHTFEPYPREYYAGYLLIKQKEKTLAYVNLRCARIYIDKAHLFVGGGITPQSNPETEWEETELKSRAVLDHLKKG